MKKVFLIHGFNSSPNSSWIPWLMGELKNEGVSAHSLAMPRPADPVCSEWIEEIARNVDQSKGDDVYLVGHSLGVAAILNYAQSETAHVPIKGAVLVSSRCEKSTNPKTEGFYDDFDFGKIRRVIQKFAVIHGDNDDRVPFYNGEKLARELGVGLIAIKDGGHLNGSAGWRALPQALEALNKMF